MSYNFGFDFRETSGYVTDPANCTYVVGDTYPTPRNGITFGWTSIIGLNLRDRDVTYPRIAGLNFSAPALTFQVDLPASGVWNVQLGCGDWSSSKLVGTIVIADGGSTLLTISHVSATNGLYDATDTDYTAANWNTSESPVPLTFSGTTLNMTISAGLGTFGIISHLFISQSGGATAFIPLLGEGGLGGMRLAGYGGLA